MHHNTNTHTLLESRPCSALDKAAAQSPLYTLLTQSHLPPLKEALHEWTPLHTSSPNGARHKHAITKHVKNLHQLVSQGLEYVK